MDRQALAKSLFRFARIIRCPRRSYLSRAESAAAAPHQGFVKEYRNVEQVPSNDRRRTSRLRKNVIFEPIFLMAGRRQVRMMAAGARRVRAVRPVLLSSSFLQTDSSRRCQKLWDADNVVGGGSENEEPRDERPPSMTGLAHHADSLHPAQGLLDALAFDHA